jgi:RecA/RadA recombinase
MEQQKIIHEIEKLCSKLDIPEFKIVNIVNKILNSIPKEDDLINLLPEELTTGFKPFDYLLGEIPRNTRLEIYGREGSGKTAIIVHILKKLVEKYNAQILWLDSSFKLTPSFFKKFGLENNLVFIQSSKITDDELEMIITGQNDILVIDDIASFKRESNPQLERIFHYSKIRKTFTIMANQVREFKSRITTPKQELLLNYDVVLSTKKYAVNTEGMFNDFNIKLEYHKQTGEMIGKNFIVPITRSGIVKDDLIDKRIDRIIKAEDFDSYDNYLKHRISINKL